MKYTILGRNMEVTEGLREYIEKKFSKLDHYFSKETEVNITLSKQRGEEKVEVTIPLRGTTIHAEESTSDMYQTIDILKDVVERQLRRNRKKIIDRKQNKQSFSDVLIEDLMGEEPEESEEEEIRIVRSKRFEMKPMTPEEACFQMEMSGHTFYMFRNAEDEQIAVVYKRKDGDYGLIEQEF
ncbi:MAG: ribosome-associated translation inhibitor RaiA [Lachnospiraceae bacterium]|jgi:putative sigma-54 modulation protein|nr:ribosome-associated translation inhibitor RaiA [Lachnospiraceae bacterium]